MPFALRRFFFSSLSIWLAIGIVGIYFVYHLPRYVNFGIDLVGGTYLTLEVQMGKVIETEVAQRVGIAVKAMSDRQMGVPREQTYEQRGVVLNFVREDQAHAAIELLQEQKLVVMEEGVRLICSLSEQEIAHMTKEAVEGNIHVLRSRVDQFGVGEIAIVPQGVNRIVVELPQVQDPKRAKALIGTSALLEVKQVLDVGKTPEELLARMGGKLLEGVIVVPDREKERGYYLVPRHAELTGRQLKTAWATAAGGELGIEPVVNFLFTPEGGEKFYQLTSHGPQALIAILIDGVVVTAARAEKPLYAEGYIRGNFTLEYAKELANLLRSGAFIAPVSFIEDRTIGPSLGAESIHKGLISCIIGVILIFFFSIFVYRLAGLCAFVVLLFNLLLILFAMALLGATLTLPGIAGMVLTLGMAIDASVLIYERIREELAAGKSLAHAVDAGFSGALVVILDANITTFLAALVFYKIGTGPMQGFAVTMMVGIISTLITGILLLRSIFRYMLQGLHVRTLSI